MKDIKAIIRRCQAVREGGHVQRCHIMPILGDASNARHQWNAAALYLLLAPEPSMRLVRYFLFHDVAERWCGDMPANAKYGMGEDIGTPLKRIERKAEEALALGLEDLDVLEECWAKAIDVLELYLFCHDQLALGNQNVRTTLKNCGVVLARSWIPHTVAVFAANYVWERTEDIIPGEVYAE